METSMTAAEAARLIDWLKANGHSAEEATECIKYLAKVGNLLTDSLLTFDALTMEWNRIRFPKNEACPLCGNKPTITELKEYAFQPCSKKKE